MQIPILLSGTDSHGVRFEAAGETLVVNKHGAKIRTEQSLQSGMDVHVTNPARKQSRPARVVWAEAVGETEAELSFGVELGTPENFWGIYFPPSDWQEPEAWDDEEPVRPETAPPGTLEKGPPRAQQPQPALGLRAPSVAAAASPADLLPVDIPAPGLQVYVRGMSAVRIPFQEKTFLRPVDQGEATIHIRLVVDIGICLQVVFPDTKRSIKVRTSGTANTRQEGRWKMWVKFIDPVRVVAPQMTTPNLQPSG